MTVTTQDIQIFIALRNLRPKYSLLVGHLHPASPSFIYEVVQHYIEDVQQDLVQQTSWNQRQVETSLHRFIRLTRSFQLSQWKTWDTILGSYQTSQCIYQGDAEMETQIVSDTIQALHDKLGIQ